MSLLHRCAELAREILAPRLQDFSDPCIQTAIESWSDDCDHPSPSPPASHQQKAWHTPRVEATYRSLLDLATDGQTRACLLAVKCRETGAWLNGLPVASLVLRLDDEAVRIAVGLRPGLPVCRSHHCVHCGFIVVELGAQGLSCQFSKGWDPRHTGVNNVIKRSLDATQISSNLEPSDLYRSDEKRPDGASIVPWKEGRVLVWDATCPDTLAHSYQQIAVREAGSVAAEAERSKRFKYANLNFSYFFVPVAVETLRVIGPESHAFLWDLAGRVRRATREPLARQYILQHLSVTVQRGNAIAT